MVLDIILIVIACILTLVGLVGCLVHGIPGTPLAWIGLLLVSFTSKSSLTWVTLVVTALVTVAVEVLNNFIPSLLTKKSGGSRAGSIGSTVGVFAGLFTGQIPCIVLGPFFGALVGELIHDHKDFNRAVRSAWYSFLGFLTGSGMRLIVSGVLAAIMIKSLF